MNILFYQHQYPAFGGIETVTTILANRFALDGNRVCIVSFIHKDGTDLLDRLKGVEWHELPEPSLDSPANRAAFMSILVAFKPDRIVFQDSYANIHAMLFDVVEKWRKGYGSMPFLSAEHSFLAMSSGVKSDKRSMDGSIRQIAIFLLRPYFYLRRFYYESRRRKMLFDNSSAYVVLSRNYLSHIRRLVGRKRMHKLCAIPNPIIGDAASDLTAKRKTVLFVGSLIPTKGVDRLLQIWAMVEKRHPDWVFRIVGDGTERISLERKVKDANLQNVSFEGFKKDPVPYYKESSIFVMASNFEGWPMVLGEAMKYGCVPVIFNSFDSATDIVEDGVNGILVKPFDKKCFAKQMETLMQDCELRVRMSKASIVKVDEYRLDAVITQWYALFDKTEGLIVVEHNSPFGRF